MPLRPLAIGVSFFQKPHAKPHAETEKDPRFNVSP
jgi:hypothetical protein